MDLTVTVNGSTLRIDGRAHENLLDALRRAGLTGCKEGCAEGECGACAVLVRRATPSRGHSSEWVAVNSCLVPAVDMADRDILTSEGLSEAAVHPVARALADAGGSQCGYCTPGFVCSASAEYYRPGRADEGFDLEAIGGNLCRCTGYRPIVEAVEQLGPVASDDPVASSLEEKPSEPTPFHVKRDDGIVERPKNLDAALTALALWSDDDRERRTKAGDEPTREATTTPILQPRVVAGSTDHGVEVNLRHLRAPRVLLIGHLSELSHVREESGEIHIGAATTLHDIDRALGSRLPLLADLWPQFASRLIRARATLGGNLGTASPIGDAAPALLALDADLVLASRAGHRRVPLSTYFTGYRTSLRRPDELIADIIIPLRPLGDGERIERFLKVAKRRTDDISSVAVAACIDLDRERRVSRARLAVGGVAATPLLARAVEDRLLGCSWSPEGIADAARGMRDLGTPMDDHRASAAYRRAMAEQALLKVCAETTRVEA